MEYIVLNNCIVQQALLGLFRSVLSNEING